MLWQMAAHASTLAITLARRLRQRADEQAPPATDADLLRSFGDPIDIEGFAREILGILPWSRQAEIFEALAEWKRIGVVSGHKTGKSTALAIIALWFYCSFSNARVVITATSDRQVNGIIWREIKRLARGALVEIPGVRDIAIRAGTGLTDPSTLSEIRGYTAKETEAIAGTSGDYILYLVDEASGVEQAIFDAIEGNRAGGNAWVFLISNPTRADGEFYDAFHKASHKALGKAGYFNIQISSEESPNVTGEWSSLDFYDRAERTWKKRTKPIPGMAAPEWIEEKRRAWGEDDPRWKIRVLGLFCVAEDSKIFGAGMLLEAQARWLDAPQGGRLWIGVDPAGDGEGGDESGFAVRRELRVLELRARSGLSPEAHIAEVQDLIASHPTKGTSKPCVIIESEGSAGWDVYVKFREHAARTGEFEVARMRTSDRAVRQPLIYDRMRDELAAVARAWLRAGGAIPDSEKLYDDLHALAFFSDIRGRLKLTPKKELRKLLGRSPDVGDAFCLCCWEPLSARMADEVQAAARFEQSSVYDEQPRGEGMNPYARGPYG